MFSFKSIVFIAAAFAVGAEGSAVGAAPLVTAAHVGYAHTVPQNIPPYASQVSVFNRALSPLVASPFAAPYFAGPAPYATYAAPSAYAAAPLGAPIGAPAAFAAPAAFPAPATYAAPPAAYAAAPATYAGAPFPYAPAAPIVRAPFGFAPAYVR